MSTGNGPEKAASEAPLARIFDSADLFAGEKTVWIRHNEGLYKLVITKQNKLILMK